LCLMVFPKSTSTRASADPLPITQTAIRCSSCRMVIQGEKGVVPALRLSWPRIGVESDLPQLRLASCAYLLGPTINSSKIARHELSTTVDFKRLGRAWLMVFFRPKATGHAEAPDWCLRQSACRNAEWMDDRRVNTPVPLRYTHRN